MGLLERLGISVTKPKVTYKLPPELSKSSQKILKERKSLYDKDAKDTAELYASWIPDDLFQELVTFHNYKNVTWGSRKSSRLINLSRNILDVEIYKDEPVFFEKDRMPVLKLLMWMSLLVVIPITRYHLGEDQEEKTKSIFREMLVDKYKALNETEFDIVILGVFDGILVNESNPVLNIFHDALRFEEVQFGECCHVELMRTELGKNDVFKVKAHNDSTSNRSPDWIIYLQEIKGVEGFVDIKASEKNARISDNDGIST